MYPDEVEEEKNEEPADDGDGNGGEAAAVDNTLNVISNTVADSVAAQGLRRPKISEIA